MLSIDKWSWSFVKIDGLYWRSDFKQSEWRDFSDRKYLLFYATDINYMYTWIPAGHGSLFSKFICMCHSHALAETTSENKLPKILQRKKNCIFICPNVANDWYRVPSCHNEFLSTLLLKKFPKKSVTYPDCTSSN